MCSYTASNEMTGQFVLTSREFDFTYRQAAKVVKDLFQVNFGAVL